MGFGKKAFLFDTLIDAFFKMDDLATVKNNVFDIMNYSTKQEVLMKNDPSVIFHYYLCMRSFIKAVYVLQFKTKKWKLNDSSGFTSILLQGSLSVEEYADSFLVFQNDFKEYTLQEFECFNAQIVYFSLGGYSDEPEANIVTLFIHLIKMLDAAQITNERGVENLRSN